MGLTITLLIDNSSVLFYPGVGGSIGISTLNMFPTPIACGALYYL